MFGSLTWDLDPILLHLGPLQIRYYGVMFAITIYTGFTFGGVKRCATVKVLSLRKISFGTA